MDTPIRKNMILNSLQQQIKTSKKTDIFFNIKS